MPNVFHFKEILYIIRLWVHLSVTHRTNTGYQLDGYTHKHQILENIVYE